MSELVLYNRHLAELRATVANLDTVDDAKELADKAAAAQTWARRVRLGQEAVNHAAEVKLRAERRAGELISETVRPGNPSFTEELRTLPEGVSAKQSHEWRALATIPVPEFDEAVEAEKAGGPLTRTGVMRRAMDVHYSSDTPEWSTPQDLYDLLHAEFDFDLDVCATQDNAKCERHYTEEDNGLEQPWTGTCWMNPPYGRVIAEWMRKAYQSAKAGATVVCLIPARTDTDWFWDYARHGEVRFLHGRLRFSEAAAGAPFPSVVVILGRPASVKWWEEWPKV